MVAIKSYQLIIVGAGPAGLSTALHLAQIAPELAAHTLILEKASHPRPKLCGGGILPDGEHVLRRLGLDLAEIPHCDVDWAHFDHAGKGMKLRGERQGSYAFRTIRRDEFDAWLANKVRQRGFTIQENTRVEKVSVDNEAVSLQTDRGDYTAALVVGADGSNSVVRRALGLPRGSRPARLLETVSAPRPEASSHIQADSYFDFQVLPQGIQGYTWDFPAYETGKAVRVRGIYDSNIHTRSTQASLKPALEEELHRHGSRLEDQKLEGFPIRRFDGRGPFSTKRILLVGDAAGADGLYGEGISFALGYGEQAARAIRAAFEGQDFSLRDYRRRLLRSEMGKALQRRAWLAWVFYLLQSRRIQALIWQEFGWLVEWLVRRFVIGWASRAEERK